HAVRHRPRHTPPPPRIPGPADGPGLPGPAVRPVSGAGHDRRAASGRSRGSASTDGPWEQASNNFPEFSQSRTKLWQSLLTQVVARSPDLATSPTEGQVPTRTPAETRGPADGGAERLDGATHFVARTSACTGSTFTGTERASGLDSLRFLKFRQRSRPPWDFRFFCHK